MPHFGDILVMYSEERVMTMPLSVFNRYEKKYFIPEALFPPFSQALSAHMEKDAYLKERDSYSILNIYFDTESDEIVRISNRKPRYKEKLRLRSYGVPSANDKVYLEIKKKVNGIVNKRRAAMTLSEAKHYLRSGVPPEHPTYIDHQVLNEIDYIRARYVLVPKLFLAYDRTAYFDRNDSSLRITFDRDIRTRRTELSLETGDFGEPLLQPGIRLLEIKTKDRLPKWLSALLSAYDIYPASFSKYGTEYYKNIMEDHVEGGRIPCLNPYLAAQRIPCCRQAV